MKYALIWIVILTSFTTACERARMSKSGQAQPAETIVPQQKEPLNTPAPAATPDTAGTPQPAAPSAQAVEPAIVPSVEVANAAPAAAQDQSTCQGDACAQAVIRDDGRYESRQRLRFEPRTKNLDVLFVLDTSASMRDEHEAIGREINRFIGELSSDVSYRFAVMLAHGPRSQSARVGTLYSVGQDPLVIHGTDAASIQSQLSERLKGLPNDRSEAQGEAGLLNLYRAFSDSEKVSAMKKAGFLRDESALLIVTVADENDVCFEYSGDVVGTYATERDRQREQAAFRAGDVCASVANGQRLTAQEVARAVRSTRQDLPVIFTGIHYLEGQVPERNDVFAKDNEAGRGYLQLIEAGEGRAVNLAETDFGVILAKIGDFSNFKMKYEDTFEIQGVKDPSRVIADSVRVMIEKSNGESHIINPENVKYRSHRGKAEVVIDYEALDFAYRNQWIDEKSDLVVLYAVKEDTETFSSKAFCLNSKASDTALLYLHGKLGIQRRDFDAFEIQNRQVLASVAEKCNIAIVGPRSSETQGCEPGFNCWNLNSKQKITKILPQIMQQAEQCVGSKPVVILGFSDGGYWTAHLSNQKEIDKSFADRIQELVVVGAPKAVKGSYLILPEIDGGHGLSEGQLLGYLNARGLCKN